MFDDDFESMLDAVCESIDTQVPRLPHRKRSKKGPELFNEHGALKRPGRVVPAENELTKPKKPKSDQEYVHTTPPPPERQTKGTFDRSQFIFSNFKSNTVHERFTEEQLHRARQSIAEAIDRHGAIYADKQDFRYMGKVYPLEAAETLLLSGTSKWTGANLDDVLEGILLTWLREKSPDDIQEYVTALGDAIRESKCMEGVYLRLNLNTVADPVPDSIRIRTHFGEVTQTKMPRKGVFTGELREKMKFFLANQGKFAGNLNTVYNGLAKIEREYTLEQTLLSWMGYVVTRAMAENSGPPKVQKQGGQLLIEERSIAANNR